VQINARFGLNDRLEVHLNHVRMPAGNGREKTKGRYLDVMSANEKNIVASRRDTYVWLMHLLMQ